MKTASQALLVQQYLSEEAVVRSSIWSTSTIYLTGKSALFCFFAFEQRALPRCSFAVGVALSPYQVGYNILSLLLIYSCRCGIAFTVNLVGIFPFLSLTLLVLSRVSRAGL